MSSGGWQGREGAGKERRSRGGRKVRGKRSGREKKRGRRK